MLRLKSALTMVFALGIGWIGRGKSIASDGSVYVELLRTLSSHGSVTKWTGPRSWVGSRCSHWNWVRTCVVEGSIVSLIVAPKRLQMVLMRSKGIDDSGMSESLWSSASSSWKKWNWKGERKGLSASGWYQWRGSSRRSRIQSSIHQSKTQLSRKRGSTWDSGMTEMASFEAISKAIPPLNTNLSLNFAFYKQRILKL